MLSTIRTENDPCHLREAHVVEGRYSRSEEEDMQSAIVYLYEFKKKLDKLHPQCIHHIERMLQKPRHF